mmetsp:Transcript_5569/g.8265  ORF Transcript_5569/g.8265 Transcript_5569/m.8265 type:complete len:237 (-) Transcript_5569:976-1686(-)
MDRLQRRKLTRLEGLLLCRPLLRPCSSSAGLCEFSCPSSSSSSSGASGSSLRGEGPGLREDLLESSLDSTSPWSSSPSSSFFAASFSTGTPAASWSCSSRSASAAEAARASRSRASMRPPVCGASPPVTVSCSFMRRPVHSICRLPWLSSVKSVMWLPDTSGTRRCTEKYLSPAGSPGVTAAQEALLRNSRRSPAAKANMMLCGQGCGPRLETRQVFLSTDLAAAVLLSLSCGSAT